VTARAGDRRAARAGGEDSSAGTELDRAVVRA
jgi:hypothetical protein